MAIAAANRVEIESGLRFNGGAASISTAITQERTALVAAPVVIV